MTTCACNTFTSSGAQPAVLATNYSGTAIEGWGSSIGVWGYADSANGIGVKGSTYGTSTTAGDFEASGTGSCGVYASGGSYAGYFYGGLWAQSYLNKPGGGFVVDHPLMPETHLLNHEFCESPKAQNLYRGKVTLDANGNGKAVLPDYYESANTDGQAFVNGARANAIVNGTFDITGGAPGEVVGWLVIADRNDLWQRTHGKPDVIAKVGDEIGRYAQPALYGKDNTFHIHERPRQSPVTPHKP